MSDSLPRVLILNTGGTLGMRSGRDGFIGDLTARVPGLDEIASLDVESPFQLDSSSMTPMHWQVLARLIAERKSSYDGIVIAHGTDTMAYTASALSFLLEGLDTTVVLTGAQRPLNEIRSDARANLIDSVEVASRSLHEVVICFGGQVLRGNRARKRSLSDFRAFESPNCHLLAEVGTRLRVHHRHLRKGSGPFRLREELDPRVIHLRLAPGLTGSSLLTYDQKDVAGIVLEAFGAGNMPLGPESPAAALAELEAQGIPVVIISGSEHGEVDLSLYAGGRAAMEAGAIGAYDMTAEAAVAKLMVALGRGHDLSAVRSFFQVDLAGEVTLPEG